MFRTLRTLALCPLLVVSIQGCGDKPAPVAAAAPAAPVTHAAPAAPSVTSTASALPAQRWQADAPLRAGMARVRAAADSLVHLAHGGVEPAQVTAAADEIRSAVNTMFAECRLAPAPDAALHPLLARLLVASQALRDAPTEAAPVAELEDVLAKYEELFDEGGSPAAPN